jgi:hypothetical protein
MSLFNKKIVGSNLQGTNLDQMVSGIQNQMNATGSSFASKRVAAGAMAMESIDGVVKAELDQAVTNLTTAMESIANTHLTAKGIKVTQAQRDAAIAIAVAGSDTAGFLQGKVTHNVAATENLEVIGVSAGDATNGRMREALEAYDERDNKSAVVYSTAYNMQAARQDEFGETLFPTVVVTPDQPGLMTSIRIISVYDDVRRQTNGSLDQFKKRNIIHAVIDPTILRNDQTKMVPVYRAGSESNFVSGTFVAAAPVLLDGESINTAPLAFGKKFSLLGLSQTDALLSTGLQDTSDSIDTAIALAAVYVKVKVGANTDVLKFNTNRLPTSVFGAAQQGQQRQMNLNFDNSSLQISVDTKVVGGGALVALAPIVAGGYTVRLNLAVYGSVNCELGDTTLTPSALTVVSVKDSNGTYLPLDSGAGATIVALFADPLTVAIGYDLDAQRSNLNRRQRGQLLDTSFYNQLYMVPLRSPISVPRPLSSGDQTDSSDLAALITTTHIRTSNAAVGELFRAADLLKAYVSSNDTIANAPSILGVTRFLVNPFYEEKQFDAVDVVDSIKSHERAKDLQAALVNFARDIAYRMYRNSGYKAAADALAGGVSAPPTVIIATDPVIAQYFMLDGDFRTLGNDFQVKIVSTTDNRMTGKFFITFGDFTNGAEGAPNPMHFGNMAWKPEMTVVLPMPRNGGISKELTVQPAFLHIVNLPCLAMVTVSNISDVIASKVTVNQHTVI